MHTKSVTVGDVLAGRYRLDALLGTDDGAQTWRAFDQALARRIGVHTLAPDHPNAAAVIAAAGEAARFADPRFLRVLDAAESDGVAYVVKEWVDGHQLGDLMGDGAMPVASAVRAVRDAAAAMAAAHAAGLAHLRLDPSSLICTDSGDVKVAGLMIEAALHGITADSPVEAGAIDARGLGALLYAGLTGHWPGDSAGAVLAPRHHDGRLRTPRQVRAAIPSAVDEVADRILSPLPRHHGEALRTPSAIAAALERLPVRRLEQADDLPVPRPTPPSDTARRPARWPRRTTRAARLAAAGTVLGGLALLGWQLGTAIGAPGPGAGAPQGGATAPPSDSGSGSGSGRATTSRAGTTQAIGQSTLPVAGATDFDPLGNGEEHPDQVPLAIDSNAGSAWRTMEYFDRPDLGGQKAGVGLVLDLGSPQQVGSVTLGLVGDGTTVALRAAAADTATAPSTLAGYQQVARKRGAAGAATLTPRAPVTTRYLLIWLTRLPPLSGDRYQGGIADVVVRP